MNAAKKQERIDEIVEEASRWGDRGYLEKQQEILEEGLSRYPDNYLMMHQLMHS